MLPRLRAKLALRHASTLLHDEISRDMAMLGIASPTQMKREYLVPSKGLI